MQQHTFHSSHTFHTFAGRLYLYTEAESSAAMYARYGWVEQERIDYYGHEAILMYLDTTQAPAAVTV